MSRPELDAPQLRVLGVLIEKAMTTPQAYPLSENAVISACNQTTARDPVVSYDQTTVRRALRELRQAGLARLVQRAGDRTEKHAHKLDEALDLSDGGFALLAVLMLRGPQTAAELRARTERMHEFPTPQDAAAALEALSEGGEPLVEQLPRQPGRKGVRYGHLLADQVTAAAPPEPSREWQDVPEPDPADDAPTVAALAEEVTQLRQEVADLRTRLDQLTN